MSTSWFKLFKTKLLAASTKDDGDSVEGCIDGHGGTQLGQFGHPWKSKTSNTSTMNPMHVAFPGGQGVVMVVVVVVVDVVVVVVVGSGVVMSGVVGFHVVLILVDRKVVGSEVVGSGVVGS